jgi:hypothetical protein
VKPVHESGRPHSYIAILLMAAILMGQMKVLVGNRCHRHWLHLYHDMSHLWITGLRIAEGPDVALQADIAAVTAVGNSSMCLLSLYGYHGAIQPKPVYLLTIIAYMNFLTVHVVSC